MVSLNKLQRTFTRIGKKLILILFLIKPHHTENQVNVDLHVNLNIRHRGVSNSGLHIKKNCFNYRSVSPNLNARAFIFANGEDGILSK